MASAAARMLRPRATKRRQTQTHTLSNWGVRSDTVIVSAAATDANEPLARSVGEGSRE